MCVGWGMCVCVREREKEREREKAKERDKEARDHKLFQFRFLGPHKKYLSSRTKLTSLGPKRKKSGK